MATPVKCNCCNGPLYYSRIKSFDMFDGIPPTKWERENGDPTGAIIRAYQLKDGVYREHLDGNVSFKEGETL